jgi:hypothetical protein
MELTHQYPLNLQVKQPVQEKEIYKGKRGVM